MFFMMGITTGRKELPFHQVLICSRCGKYGGCSVYMTYTVLSLFFIPCFKWNRRYYVTMHCCGAVYELDPETGKRIARGESPEITEKDIVPVGESGWGFAGSDNANIAEIKRCENCGFTTEEDYDYCPRCGKHL